MKRKSLFVIALCVAMLLSTVGAYAADLTTPEERNIVDRVVSNGTVSMERVRDLRAAIELTCSSTAVDGDYIKATITVQRKYSSGWDQYYAPYTIYGDAEQANINYAEYIDVQTSGTYRVKVVFEDSKNGIVSKLAAKYSQSVSL